MKKILIPVLLVVIGASGKAQSEKNPPPPPPKPQKEVVKFTPPKIIKDENVEVSKYEPPVITIKGKMADEFYERNPTVLDISKQGNTMVIKKKDGTTEKFNINKTEEEKSFTEKYGASPIPPPPPPPKKKSKA